MPVLPGITDAESDLRAVVRAAADAGAQFVAHQTLFLEGPARSHFVASLRRAYPRIAARYEVWTRCGRSLPLEVRSEVAARVRAAVRESGIEFPSPGFPPRPPAESQRCFEFVA
jgi:DNA repair photolyase